MVTDHSGRQYLLRAAKPTDYRGDELLDPEKDTVVYGDLEFRDQREGEKWSSMRSGNSLAVGRTEYDPDAIVSVANPIARWVEKSAQHTTDLLAEVDRLREELAGLKQGYARLEARCDHIAKAAVSWRKEADGRKAYGLTLRARVAELEEQAEKTAAFAAQRAEYVTNLRQFVEGGEDDYWRWTGHAEARRQLSQALGLPVGWPAEDKQSTAPDPSRDESVAKLRSLLARQTGGAS
ncbi:hypothetical protein ABZ609_03290 [Streptomyces rubiginosohelvolus]|uniref:hypothetical protein n=1 Tax=Streptomyces rubiginosohelvolus TaxID=67362 RepID=UPI0034053A54